MKPIELADLTVSEIMRRWPAAMRLFIDRRLLCVGCPIAPFHTLTDVAREHGVDYDDLLEAVLVIANALRLGAGTSSKVSASDVDTDMPRVDVVPEAA